MAMDSAAVIDVLVRYGTDQKAAEESARIWEIAQDKALKSTLTKEEQLRAQATEKNIAAARRYFKEIEEGRIKSETYSAKQAKEINNKYFADSINLTKRAAREAVEAKIKSAQSTANEEVKITQEKVAKEVEAEKVGRKAIKAERLRNNSAIPFKRIIDAKKSNPNLSTAQAKEQIFARDEFLRQQLLTPAQLKNETNAKRVNANRTAENERLANVELEAQAKLRQINLEWATQTESEFKKIADAEKAIADEKQKKADEYLALVESEKATEQQINEEWAKRIQNIGAAKREQEQADKHPSGNAENVLREDLKSDEAAVAEHFASIKAFNEEAYTEIQKGRAEDDALETKSQHLQVELIKKQGNEAREEKQKEVEAAQQAVAQKIEAEKRATQEAQTEYRKQLHEYQAMASKIGRVAQMIAVASGAAFYGALRLAQGYIANMQQMGKSNDVTKQWTDSMKDMEKSWLRIGAVIADKLLPHLVSVAAIVSKIADFVEAHPDLTGGVVIGAGILTGLSSAVAVLMRLSPLITQIMMTSSATSAVAGAGSGMLFAPAVVGAATSGGIMASLAPILPYIVATVVAAVAAYLIAKNVVEPIIIAGQRALGMQETDVESGFTAGKQALAVSGAGWAMLAQKIRNVTGITELFGFEAEGAGKKAFDAINKFTGLSQSIEKAGEGAEQSSVFGKYENQVVKSYKSMMEDIANLEKQYQQDVTSVIAQAKAQQLALESQHQQNVSNILRAYADNVANITKSYQEAEAQAAQAYEEARANAIQSANEQLESAQESHLERLQKMQEEHNSRVGDLVRARDALGLVKENRDFARAKRDEDAQYKKQMAEIRKNLAKALAEMSANYAKEQARRKEEYEKQLAEAAKQKAEQLKAEQEQYDAQKKSLEENYQMQLQALADNLNEQIRLRREGFSQMLLDLAWERDAELQIRSDGYNAMLAQAEGWAIAMGNIDLVNGTPKQSTDKGERDNAPIMDEGGYATKGLYRLADNGKREWVLDSATTKAAEKLLGGSLSQNKIMAMLAGGSSNKQITLNDNRRFDSKLSLEDRMSIKNDTINILSEVLRGV